MTGQCLCGAVTVTATLGDQHHVCHCATCRRWNGGPPSFCVDTESATFTGDTIRVYDSSEWAQRGFCGTCGTHLFYRITEAQKYWVSMGVFDDTETFTFVREVFIDQKPAHYALVGDRERMTGEEAFAHFTGG